MTKTSVTLLIGLIAVALFVAAPRVMAAEGTEASADSVSAVTPFVCDGTEIICDPVPGDTTDTQYYNGGAKLVKQVGRLVPMSGGKAFYGKLSFTMPVMQTGSLAFEIKGITDSQKAGAPYFIQINNGKGGYAKAEWQIMPRGGMVPRTEFQYYGCCEAPNYMGKLRMIPLTPDGFYVLVMKWTASTVNLYQGRGTGMTLVHTMPNRLGNYRPPNWKGNVCKNRPTGGAILPTRIDLPEDWMNTLDYYIRNVRLTAQ